jgi:Protein of unknown function (DUF2867)
MNAVIESKVPPQSLIHSTLPSAYFYDAYSVASPNSEHSALQIWLDALPKMPIWIDRAMQLRNFIVSKVGLRDAGKLSNVGDKKPINDYKVGDQVGVFTLRSFSPDEVVMGDNDKHLDVQISLCKVAGNQVVVSTVVHVHNWMGRIYMFFVTPMHRVIVPKFLSKI